MDELKKDETLPPKRGGRRPGSGRKRKRIELGPIETPIELLEAIIRSDDVAPSVRLNAAKTLIEIERRREVEKQFGGPGL